MSSSSRRVWVSRCRRPTGWAGRARQSHVDDVGGEPRVELLAVDLLAAAADQRLDRPARLVGRLADLAALLRRQLGHAAQQLRQLGLAPEVLDAEALELVGGARARDRIRGRVLDLLDAVDHLLTSYIATVAAMAAFSDSDAIGMWHTSSHSASTASGSPRAPRRPPASRRAPAARPAAGPRRRPSHPPPRQLVDPAHADHGTEKIAPIEARTALCPYGSALPGPSATLPAPNASAERRTVPTLPGSPTPHSATHSGPAGSGAQRIG
jgi:hypothetical protein